MIEGRKLKNFLLFIYFNDFNISVVLDINGREFFFNCFLLM